MRILTVIKRVPDSRVPLKIKADGSGIETADVKYVCDPFDEFGVELAVQLRAKRSDVQEIVAIAAGPAETTETLRQPLAMGADRAVHVCDPAAALWDELWLARVIAAAVRRDAAGFDLVLCGKQNIDNDAGELGPALAEGLDLPHVGAVTAVEVAEDGRSLRARRRIEGAEEVVDAALPALLTCEKGLVEPRYPPLPAMMKAKKKPIETIEVAALEGVEAGAGGAGVTLRRMALPPARPACCMLTGEPAAMARELVRRLREEAKAI